MTGPSHHDESGAVAILYSILMLVVIALVALVLDIGAMRVDRRSAQTVADFASTAGVSVLATGGGGPDACDKAWSYVVSNIPELASANSPCRDSAGATRITWDCTSPPAVPTVGTDGTANPYYVEITWPVPDSHPAMLGESYTDYDGDPCNRVGVGIERVRGFVFGGWIAPAGSTGASAVARWTEGFDEESAVALIVLDPTGCGTLIAKGGGTDPGGVWVWEAPGGEPGRINVDSDASGCGGGKYVIDTDGLGGPPEIKAGVNAIDPVTLRGVVGNGVIKSFALQPANNPNKAYDPNDAPPLGDRIVGGDPTPGVPIAGERATRGPIDHRYDCRTGYSFPGHPPIEDCPEPPLGNYDPADPTANQHITNLRAHVATTAANIAADPLPPVVDGYAIWSRLGLPCNIDNSVGLLIPSLPAGAEDWWIDCPAPNGLTTSGSGELRILEGNVVFDSKINLQGGRLSINPDSPRDTFVFVRSGDLDKAAGAALRLGSDDTAGADGKFAENCDPLASCDDRGGVFVLLDDGRLIAAGGGSEMTWSAPLFNTEDYPACPDSGPFGCAFEDLAMWSEGKSSCSVGARTGTCQQTLSGDVTSLAVEGTFFMPNSHFNFSGSGQMGQQRAQFISYSLEASGNGALSMVPDPSRQTLFPETSLSLIR